jgi:hypothetical protein
MPVSAIVRYAPKATYQLLENSIGRKPPFALKEF